MEIAIIERSDVRFATTSEMRLLFTYICDPWPMTYDEVVGDDIYIYDAYDDQLFVKMKERKVNELSDQLEKVNKQKPNKILVRKENEEFIFEGSEYNWDKMNEITLVDLNFEDSDIFKLPDKFFDGGFHYIPKEGKQYFEFINKYYDKNEVVASDVKLEKDLIVNHLFFPENWSVDYVKMQILKSLNHPGVKKYVEVSDKVFSFYGYADEAITIQTMINNKGEVVTAYPISKKKK